MHWVAELPSIMQAKHRPSPPNALTELNPARPNPFSASSLAALLDWRSSRAEKATASAA